MSVAKSYQNYEIVKKPYENNNKFYVDIDFKGKIKTVRWYEEPMKKIRPLKEVLGFTKGYITIFKGDTHALLEWFQEEPKCRYHCSFGWYCVSEEELPTHISAGIEPIKLYWTDIANVEEDTLKSEEEIKQHINSLIYESTSSEWQGEVGDRIERQLTVTKVIPLDTGFYGPSTFHLFVDADGNEYSWTTGSKTLEVGASYLTRGTIKELKIYHNSKQTVLNRCILK